MNAFADIIDQVLKQIFCKRYLTDPKLSSKTGPRTITTVYPPHRNTNRKA